MGSAPEASEMGTCSWVGKHPGACAPPARPWRIGDWGEEERFLKGRESREDAGSRGGEEARYTPGSAWVITTPP